MSELPHIDANVVRRARKVQRRIAMGLEPVYGLDDVIAARVAIGEALVLFFARLRNDSEAHA